MLPKGGEFTALLLQKAVELSHDALDKEGALGWPHSGAAFLQSIWSASGNGWGGVEI